MPAGRDGPLDIGDLYVAFIPGDHTPPVEFLLWLTTAYRLSGALSVLDIGCGTGRLLVPLSDAGWRMTGLEPCEEFLARARHAVCGSEPAINLRHGGLLDIDDQGRFDAMIAISDPFWYLLSATERAEALQRVYTALKPGGIVVLGGANFVWILQHYRSPSPSPSPSPSTVRRPGLEITRSPTHEIDPHDAVWIHRDCFTVSQNGVATTVRDEHRFAILTPPEVTSALQAAGFGDIQTFSNFESRASERVAGPHMIFAARRPG